MQDRTIAKWRPGHRPTTYLPYLLSGFHLILAASYRIASDHQMTRCLLGLPFSASNGQQKSIDHVRYPSTLAAKMNRLIRFYGNIFPSIRYPILLTRKAPSPKGLSITLSFAITIPRDGQRLCMRRGVDQGLSGSEMQRFFFFWPEDRE